MSGICSVGQFDPATGNPGAPITGTTIHGFRVVGFTDTGILFFNDARTVVSGNRAIGNGGYGIAAFVNSHIAYTHNVATGSEEAGFYIGDSPGAEAVVRFHTWLRAADRSASTVRVYGTVAAEFVAFAGTTVGWHIATPGTPTTQPRRGPSLPSC